MAVWIWKMPVGYDHYRRAKERRNPDPAIGIGHAADLNARRVSIIGNNFAVRESEKALNERCHAFWRDIDAVLRNRLQRGVRRRSGVPIKLHIHAPWPLDHSVFTDRIVERSDEKIRTVRLRRPNCRFQVGHEIIVEHLWTSPPPRPPALGAKTEIGSPIKTTQQPRRY